MHRHTAGLVIQLLAACRDRCSAPGSDERGIMTTEKSATRDTKRRIAFEDRERMTQKALIAIRRTGPAAALERCSRLADQIEAELSQRQSKGVIEPSELEDLLAFLERAAAVLKKL